MSVCSFISSGRFEVALADDIELVLEVAGTDAEVERGAG